MLQTLLGSSGPDIVLLCMVGQASCKSSRFYDLAFASLCFQRVVVGFLATRLGRLNILVLPVETTAVLLLGDNLLQHGLLTVLVLQATAEELCWAFNDGADLRECGYVVLRVVFLVVALGIKDAPHLQELQVSAQFWGEIGLGHVEPL